MGKMGKSAVFNGEYEYKNKRFPSRILHTPTSWKSYYSKQTAVTLLTLKEFWINLQWQTGG